MRKLPGNAFLFTLLGVALIFGLYWLYAPRCTSGDCENGWGVREQRSIFRYEGEFRNGKANGKGTFESLATGHRYEGQWRDGQMHGYGKYTYPDQTVYEGQWENNQRKEVSDSRD